MEFKSGDHVLAMNGEDMGTISRVVINPKSKQVTDIVVHTGVVMTHDKVIPVDEVEVGERGLLRVRLDANQLKDLPDFIETDYRAVNEAELDRGQDQAALLPLPALYWYPPYLGTAGFPGAGIANAEAPYVKETTVNIPEGTVAVKAGAKVIAPDGQELGRVERVLTSPGTDRVTHFVIEKGRLLKEEKLVPTGWVDRLEEDQVHLAVGAQVIQDLPDYRQPAH